MIKRISSILFLFVFCVSGAVANDHCPTKNHGKRNGDPTPVVTGGGPSVTDAASSTSRSSSTSAAASASKSSSTSQATGGSSTATQSQTAAGGNADAVNGGQSNTQVTNEVRQAPSAIAPDAYPSAPCRVSGSAGASSPFGGVSFGGSKLDDQCDKRETARSFALMGQTDAAIRILCTTKAAVQAKLVICQTPAAPAASATTYRGPVPAPTPEQVHGTTIVETASASEPVVSLGEYVRALKTKASTK